jgi:hypothetical protein
VSAVYQTPWKIAISEGTAAPDADIGSGGVGMLESRLSWKRFVNPATVDAEPYRLLLAVQPKRTVTDRAFLS